MSLSLIYGSSGSGKSMGLYNRIIKESMENKDKNFLIIVPEQYTMSTQRQLVSMHPNKCIMNIDVLSFNRLAYRVFEEIGAAVHTVLDDTGKSLVIRKLVENHIDELRVLKNNITRISYITQVKSLISEMNQYNITPEKLQEMVSAPTMSESFRRKATDLAVLYEAFLDFIQGKYVTTESILSTLDSMLDSSQIVDGATVVLDGFTGFTPIQYQLVEHLLKICDEVAVTITADEDTAIFEKQPDSELFSMSCEFAVRMAGLAKKAGVEISEPTFISNENGWLSSNPVLSHLEKNIFRNKQSIYKGDDANDSIILTSLKNSREELKYVAITINRLVRQGMRYKDIAVVAPNLEQYRYLVSGIWEDYNIPYFVDAKTEILFHPMSEAIDSLFDIFNRNFRREDVFRFLRTGLTDLSFEEIDYLENYVIATGIRGKNKYFHPFAIRSNTFSEDEDLLRANAIREKFVKAFVSFDNTVGRGADVRTIATALYDFLVSFNMECKIKEKGEAYQQKNPIKAKEYSQIYPVIMDILDKMVGILGDDVMDLEEFHDIYQAGLSAASIGIIPPAADSVILGDIERTRLSNIKVLFCLGASDDSIPKKVENGGILSQLEREQLLDLGFDLAPSDRQKSFRQRFYLYLMLTKPNCKLYLTMPRVDNSGKGVNPSYLVDVIGKIFPAVKLNEIEEFSDKDKLLAKKSAVNYLIGLVNKVVSFGFDSISKDERKTLESLLLWAQNAKGVDLDSILNAQFYVHEPEHVSREVMTAINETFNEDETVSGSVSKFEEYNECPYKYFLTYVMGIKEREEFELSSIDMGNFFHEAIERYSDSLKVDGKSWKSVTSQEREAYVDMAISQTFESMAKISTLEDSTQRYIVDTMKDTLRYTVEVITTQVNRGEFEPAFFEEQIKTEIIDPYTNEVVANLRGKVDRIDIAGDDDKAVRIIDYKSSGHKLDLSECYYGLSLQLPIYMAVVLEKLKDVYPDSKLHSSAMLYYEMANKYLEISGLSSSMEEERLKLSKMEGLLSSDKDDLRANDFTVGIEEGKNDKSSIVPYSIKKDGDLTQTTNAISREDMDTVMTFAKNAAAYTANDIIAGKFDCSPARHGTIDGCRFCRYKSICHFDESQPGFEARNLEKIDRKMVIEMMKDTIEGDQ
ncbi:MAG: exodeoxyribonuclease V subunit gamma [Pseudobutyrivibrio sp.]|nr:exodeoxyribonuclease V subunit gamma [Pseudobutyrivibrio sp.]